MPKQNDRKQKIQHILSDRLDVGSKLQEADPDIQEYVRALENQCIKMYAENHKMKAENVTLKGRILDLEKHPHGNIIIKGSD